MAAPRTYTYTWTQTRLETIQDQFRYFMTYGDIDEALVDDVVYAVGEKAIEAVGLYGRDSSELRVIEVQLRVDWKLNAELSLTIPTLDGGLTGWDSTQAPEVKVAGRRFAEAARRLQLKTHFWILLSRAVRDEPAQAGRWRTKLGLTGSPPAWKAPPSERGETLFDLPEVRVSILRAGDK